MFWLYYNLKLPKTATNWLGYGHAKMAIKKFTIHWQKRPPSQPPSPPTKIPKKHKQK